MKFITHPQTKPFCRLSLLAALLILSLATLQAQQPKVQQWKELHTGVTEDLYDVCCIDTSTVFVCGQNVILKTTDGGESWEKVFENTDSRISLIDFADGLTGYSYGRLAVIQNGITTVHYRQLLKTTDGGTTWMEIGDPLSNFPEQWEAKELYCLDTATLLLCSAVGTVKSSDGGLTFRTTPTAGGWIPHFYFEDHVGYLMDRDEGIVYKSTDEGETWERVYQCEWSWDGLMAINYKNKDSISLFGRFDLFNNRIDTYDGFETVSFSQWHPHSEDDGELLFVTESPTYDYEFTSNQNGCFVSCWGALDGEIRWVAFITNDGGNTWSFCYDGLNCYNPLNAIDGIDTIYYIAADHGIVYRTGTPDWIYPWNMDESPSLNEPLVYPNPAESQLNIEESNAELVEFFDNTGKKLFSSKVEGRFTLDTSQYPPGVYMIRVTNKEGKTSMKKVIKKNFLK